FAGLERPQMARRRLRLLALLRPGRRPPDPRHVHPAQLSPFRGGRPSKEPPRLGPPPRPPLPRPQALVPDPRTGPRKSPDPPPPRSGQRPMARRTGEGDPRLARPRPGGLPDRLPPPRAPRA